MKLWKFIAAAAFLALAGCVTYPYASGFAACDARAGQCYRDCEAYEGSPDYGLCHNDCEDDADICFDQAYDPYRYAGGYGPSTYYGSYGTWYPQAGFVFSFGSSRYGYSHRYDRHRGKGRRHRGGYDDDDHGGGGHGGGGHGGGGSGGGGSGGAGGGSGGSGGGSGGYTPPPRIDPPPSTSPPPPPQQSGPPGRGSRNSPATTKGPRDSGGKAPD